MQALGEEQAVSGRKQAAAYDDVLKYQRELMYAARNHLLDGGTLPASTIMRIARENIRSFLEECKSPNVHQLNRYILDNLSYRLDKEGVMQALAREQARTPTGEGLRMRTGNGWVYLTPIARRSALRIVAEGPDLELAAELCDFYAGRAAEIDRTISEQCAQEEDK